MHKKTIVFQVVLTLMGFAILGILACNQERTPQSLAQQTTGTEHVDTQTYHFKAFAFDTRLRQSCRPPKL